MPPSQRPTLAVDLRAMVPELTGIGIYTRSLLLALARRRGARYLGVAHRSPRGEEALRRAGVRVEVQRAPLGVLWQQVALPWRLRRGDVDLLWSPLATLPRVSPVPGVVTVHDLTALLYPETHRLKVRWSLLPFLEHTLTHARRVVAVSEATAADLRRMFPHCASRLRVVGEAADPELRPASPEAIAAIRKELGMPEGYVLYVGTLEPRKNLGSLLDAWELARRERPGQVPPLVLAGGYGWHSQALMRRLRTLAPLGVTHLGRQARGRLVRLFQAARVFAFPSLYEGFGLPPLEAMACGVPVVASDTSSLPEVVGDAGLLVAPRDTGALAAALLRVLSEPTLAEELGERGRERSLGLTWEKAAAAMEEVLLEALSSG